MTPEEIAKQIRPILDMYSHGPQETERWYAAVEAVEREVKKLLRTYADEQVRAEREKQRWVDIRRSGDYVLMEYSVDGKIVATIRERLDSNFSHGCNVGQYEKDSESALAAHQDGAKT